MPMLTKYSAEKDGGADVAKRLELKFRDVEKNGIQVVYLSKTKSVVPTVKREAFIAPTIKNDEVHHFTSTSAFYHHHQEVLDLNKN